MTNLTELETKVITTIVTEEVKYDNDGSKGWGPDLPDLIKDTGIEVKILRGVLGSLIKKNVVDFEPGHDGPDLYCSNFSLKDSLKFLADLAPPVKIYMVELINDSGCKLGFVGEGYSVGEALQSIEQSTYDNMSVGDVLEVLEAD